jgi:serine/threonine protein kinase
MLAATRIENEEPVAVPACRFAPGREVGGRYRLERVIGRGGMGTVFAALDRTMGEIVAIKTLHLGRGEEDIRRFAREARAIAAIDHPAVVRVLDVGTNDAPYLVLELLRGASLRDVIERGRLTEAGAVAVMEDVLSGVEAAHAAGVLHRDLKPDNVFIHWSAGAPVVKIIDFGIAKMRDDIDPIVTRPGIFVGTPGYMAPEQALGRALDERVDVYALGVLAYELFAGHHPFADLPPHRLIPALLRGDVRRIEGPLGAWIATAMHVDPNRRFANVAEARAAFAALNLCGSREDLPEAALHSLTDAPTVVSGVFAIGS